MKRGDGGKVGTVVMNYYGEFDSQVALLLMIERELQTCFGLDIEFEDVEPCKEGEPAIRFSLRYGTRKH